MNARSALFEAFERAGFRLVRCNRHAIWACPCGHALVTTPSTPGRGRGSNNSMSQLGRTLAACKKNLEERDKT